MYYNPVKVIETNDWEKTLFQSLEKLNIENPLVVSSQGNTKRNNLNDHFNSANIFHDIENNPTLESCQRAIDYVKNTKYDGVVAMGGGSTMDTAKTMMAAVGNKIYSIQKLLSDKLKFHDRLPAVFIPTTHGTGSEATMWGTVWDIQKKCKFSLSHQALYPDVAILDGSLTTSLSIELSVTTILDALSHCFETLWNKNCNPKSAEFAISAICILLTETHRIKKQPENVVIRKYILKAANLAGLAFSNTKTAAAHSISYPLTIDYGIPHGIACSMPIIPLLQINKKAIRIELERIYTKLHLGNLSDLETLILQMPKDIIDFNLSKWGVKVGDLTDIANRAIYKSRISNNIIPLNNQDILFILKQIM